MNTYDTKKGKRDEENHKSFRVEVYDRNNEKEDIKMKYKPVCKYVPIPQPVTCNRTIACHYYPGWKKGKSGHANDNGFYNLKDYPERTPLLGYYDEANPEVTDWEIKWAVEHGINCFIYCWYRYRENLGKPVTRDALRLGYALHDGLFNARYQDYMKFAIMFECSPIWATAADEDDFLNHVLRFWIDNYFSRDNYLRLPDGTPVIYVYSQKYLIEALGGDEKCAEILEKAREMMRREGFTGLHFSAINSVHQVEFLKGPRKSGFDSTFQYCWFFYPEMIHKAEYQAYLESGTRRLPPEIVIRTQLQRIKERIACDPYWCMFTNSVMRDSSPWYNIPHFFTPEKVEKLIQWWLQPKEWRSLLKQSKELIDKLPSDSIGNQIFIIDNWNEFGEGHYVTPTAGYGFQYLQAIREVFTECDNLPDYRLPQTLGLGPYDREYSENQE